MTHSWWLLLPLGLYLLFYLLMYFFYKQIIRRVESKVEKLFLFFLWLLCPILFVIIVALMYQHVREFEIDGLYYAIRCVDEDFVVALRNKDYLCPEKTYSGNVVIPEHITYDGDIYRVTTIENYTFAYSTHLTSVTIPKSVTSIGLFAFAFCRKLKDIYCLAENVPDTTSEPRWRNNTFTGLWQGEVTLHVPAASVQAYREKSKWRNFGKIVAIEDTDECMKNVLET